VTLVELLITAALAGVVAGMAAIFYVGAWRNFADASDRASRLGRLAGALTTLTGDIRAARGVVAAAPGRLDLWSADRNADGFAQADEIVAYRVEPAGPGASRLVRQAQGARTILVEGLGVVVWATDAPPPAAGRVWISMATADAPPVITSVALRNALAARPPEAAP
jgi:Tfp pilus assembly protein PilW